MFITKAERWAGWTAGEKDTLLQANVTSVALLTSLEDGGNLCLSIAMVSLTAVRMYLPCTG